MQYLRSPPSVCVSESDLCKDEAVSELNSGWINTWGLRIDQIANITDPTMATVTSINAAGFLSTKLKDKGIGVWGTMSSPPLLGVGLGVGVAEPITADLVGIAVACTTISGTYWRSSSMS
jgi:hypothetical protein